MTVDETPVDDFIVDTLLCLLDEKSPTGYKVLGDALARNNKGHYAALHRDTFMLVKSYQDEFDEDAQMHAPKLRRDFYDWSSEFAHTYWDKGIPLPYEGGSEAWLGLEIFSILCHRGAINTLPPTWSGQVKRRLVLQATLPNQPFAYNPS